MSIEGACCPYCQAALAVLKETALVTVLHEAPPCAEFMREQSRPGYATVTVDFVGFQSPLWRREQSG